jgi:hypothetical protein
MSVQFRVVTTCRLVVDTNTAEKHVSIFRAEVIGRY